MDRSVRLRTRFLAGLFALLVMALGAQMGRLALLQNRQLAEVAEEQRYRELPLPAPRGVLYDRNLEPMVLNRAAFRLLIRYPHYQDQSMLRRLCAALEISYEEVEPLLTAKQAYGDFFEPIRLPGELTGEQVATVVERRLEFPGVEVVGQPVRVYPHGELAAHVLGYVNQIGPDELKSRRKDGYLNGDLIGRTGLEAFYEGVLRGKTGLRLVAINTLGEPLSEALKREPQTGNSLVLTLDAQMQRTAEQALEWTMWRIRNLRIGDGPWPNAKAGAVVVMEVKTGRILAMASRPAYDPNLFARGITASELRALQDPLLTPEVNRAVHSAYQPGSTWKMLTSAAALEAGVVQPDERIFCSGVYDKAGNPKDWVPWGHGWVDTVGALKGSCDIYYYEMGYRLGIDRLMATALEFGFGERTGIDLGAENPGLLPDEENRELIWGRRLNDPWGIGHTVSSSIGQIVQVTPLQLVRYVATLGNGGRIMQPYLVDRVLDEEGKVIQQFLPREVGVVGLSQAHLKTILEGMGAVDAPNFGTSDFALYPLPGVRTGGKTGTAEYPPWDDYGFFVGLAPLHDPEIAVAVVVEQAAHGSSTAPVARAVFATYFGVELPERDPARVPPEFPNDLNALRRKYPVLGSGE